MDNRPPMVPGAIPAASSAAPAVDEAPSIIPIIPTVPSVRPLAPLTPVVCDERAIAGLLALLLSKGGLSISAAARIWGVDRKTVAQYISGSRAHPSLLWFLRFAELCGARVLIEFPR